VAVGGRRETVVEVDADDAQQDGNTTHYDIVAGSVWFQEHFDKRFPDEVHDDEHGDYNKTVYRELRQVHNRPFLNKNRKKMVK
jgi:hypothetical protein